MEKTYSKYARIFDEVSVNCSEDQKVNLMFIKLCQQHANDLLKRKGTVFLNEVYEMLGLPKSKEGCVVGWHYDEKNPIGDNYIDFGLSYISDTDIIVLDFNVDGRVVRKAIAAKAESVKNLIKNRNENENRKFKVVK